MLTVGEASDWRRTGVSSQEGREKQEERGGKRERGGKGESFFDR
ncbi:hypothetical protein [Okeania sp. SIO1I7]|nr:hypothetical protein [Okeania sp. SIO1I7]